MVLLSGSPQLEREDNISKKGMPYRRSSRLAHVALVVCFLMLLLGTTQSVRGQTTVEESQVKAAFLFHFAQLVDWPADPNNDGNRSLIICVFDDDPQRHELQSTLEGKLVGERVLHVRLLSDPQAASGCKILFLSRDESPRHSATLRD